MVCPSIQILQIAKLMYGLLRAIVTPFMAI